MTDEPGCKGIVVEGGTRATEPKGTNLIVEIATAGWVPETRRPKEGTRGGTSRAQVVVAMIDSMMGSRLTRIRGHPRVIKGSSCILKQNA